MVTAKISDIVNEFDRHCRTTSDLMDLRFFNVCPNFGAKIQLTGAIDGFASFVCLFLFCFFFFVFSSIKSHKQNEYFHISMNMWPFYRHIK